jgi:putative ABC transport system permease protein
MLFNYLKVAARNIAKHRGAFLINTLGLSLGLTCFLIIMLFVADELSYDRFHEKSDQIVRVVFRGKMNGELIKEAVTMGPVASTLLREFPEVIEATRLRNYGNPKVTVQNNSYREGRFAYVDSNFFQVFTLPLIMGDPATVLKEPNTVILTREQALKYFGNDNPMGQMLNMEEWDQQFMVTGIIEKVPENSHFHFDLFASMESLDHASKPSWLESNYFNYLVLEDGYDYKDLEAKLPMIVEKYMGPQVKAALGISFTELKEKGNEVGLFLQPLTDIHLRSDFSGYSELEPGGDINIVYIFSAVALFMLLIACINFMNLATAGASKREKEIGIRKVLGSQRKQLIAQFLSESFFATGFALMVAFSLLVLALPTFNSLSGKMLNANSLMNPQVLCFVFGFWILISLFAGSYPALFLSSFKPISILGRGIAVTGNTKGIRSGLVVFQFILSAGLILATMIVDQQMSFIQNKELGYHKDQMLVIPNSWMLGDRENTFKEQLLNDHRVKDVAMSGYIPVGSNKNSMSGIYPGQQSDEFRRTVVYHIDDHYIPTMGMQLIAGRNFSSDYGEDSLKVIINETAAKTFGIMDDPLGKALQRRNNEGDRENLTVIGVIKDFHYRPLYEKIEPLILLLRKSSGLIIKSRTSDMPELVASIKQLWTNYQVDEPFSHNLLDETYQQVYLFEQNVARILRIFAILTILIACLGLFGLVTFTTQQRLREIGIRKILGSTVTQIVTMLSMDFIKLVFISLVIAFPVAYWLMGKWLQDFAYRTEIHWWIYAATGLITLLIALITVSVQTIRAATRNPIKALRTE